MQNTNIDRRTNVVQRPIPTVRLFITAAVLTNGHIGHVPRAPGFFLFERPPTGCGEIFLKLIILLPSQRSTVRETR